MIMPNLHIFSNSQRPLKAMQEAITAAMAVKKLGEAFGMEVKDVLLQLPEGMAAELGLPKGTILNVTNMRMDQNNEVILEGTLTSKDLKAEKNFILVASASTIAAELGQTKRHQRRAVALDPGDGRRGRASDSSDGRWLPRRNVCPRRELQRWGASAGERPWIEPRKQSAPP